MDFHGNTLIYTIRWISLNNRRTEINSRKKKTLTNANIMFHLFAIHFFINILLEILFFVKLIKFVYPVNKIN